NDRTDLLSITQSHIAPGLAAIDRFVETIAHREVRPQRQPFATANVENVRIRWRNSQVADRTRRLIVEDRLPCVAIIGRLPYAAVVDTDIEDIGLPRHTCSAYSATCAERSDASPAQRLVKTLAILLSSDFNERHKRNCDECANERSAA